MKAYSLDLRSKIVAAHLAQKMSSEESSHQVCCEQKPRPKIGETTTFPRVIYSLNRGVNHNERHLTNAEALIRTLVAEHQDATLVELCELFAIKTGNWVSRTAMCRYLQKLGLNRKKNMAQ
ncbi:hypothetical protein QUB63_32435 [Microcoleus sp. ARI1-B5]|uniref:hypothetical protein n=1 Tax=unclassified Microcoleus TaxID=2642155 RepID=UPI002FD78A14